MHFKAGHAAGRDWKTACREALEQLGPLTAQFTLGFFYINDPIAADLAAVYNALRAATGFCNWVGAVGYGVCGLAAAHGARTPNSGARSGAESAEPMAAGEYFNRPAVTLLATDMPREDFRVFALPSDDLSDFGARHGAWIAETRPQLAVVHGDSHNPRTQTLIARLAQETGAFLAGGMASFTSARNQLAAGTAVAGLSGVMFASRVAAVSGLSQGSAPLGPVHRITSAERNIIITLDGRPALDVLIEDVGLDDDLQLRQLSSHLNIALMVPNSDLGEYVVRNLVGIDPARRLIATSEAVQPGDRMMICARDREIATTDLRRMVGNIAARGGAAAKGALYFSCVARGPNLFGPDAEEVKLLRDGLPGVPLAGFYANGEISSNRLYGYTGVLVTFR